MFKSWFEEVKWKVCVCKLTLPHIEDDKMAPDMYMTW